MDDNLHERLMASQAVGAPQEPEMETPGSDQFKTIEFLVQDESVPDIFRNLFWAFADKENEIANMNEREIIRAVAEFDIGKLWYILSRPQFEFSFPESLNLAQLRHKFKVKLSRSRMGFERRQISGHETARKVTMAQPPKKGHETLGRVFGRGKKV